MRLAGIAVLVGFGAVGCNTVTRDGATILTQYESRRGEAVVVQVQDQSFRVTPNDDLSKVMVLLSSGAISRALAKDFGQQGTALPEAMFIEAAAKATSCKTGATMRRQDYLWEIDVRCS